MQRREREKFFSGQNVLLIGLGLHGGGVATAQWLLRNGANVRITDRRTAPVLASSLKKIKKTSVSWSLGTERLRDVNWADWIVQNPGVPETNALIVLARRLKKPIQNEAGLFLRYAPCPVIGITGTRGKTTTALLTAHLLRAEFSRTVAVGNLRDLPVLKALPALTPTHRVVAEFSSFQLEGLPAVQRSPHIAVWTNLFVDHLNRYGTMSDYLRAKSRILEYQTSDDIAILNADAANIRQLAGRVRGRLVWFSTVRHRGTWSFCVQAGWVVERRGKTTTRIARLSAFPLAGEHQRHNLLAAIAAARASDVSVRAIQRALPTFPGVPHRQEIIRTWRGHRWINDTTATSPEGALAGIATFPSALYILGGTDKRLDFRPLIRVLARRSGPVIFLPGTATDIMLRLLARARASIQPVKVSSMNEAVREAAARAIPGQDIVLTPGAASFGLFIHEFDRGDQFTKAVKKLR